MLSFIKTSLMSQRLSKLVWRKEFVCRAATTEGLVQRQLVAGLFAASKLAV